MIVNFPVTCPMRYMVEFPHGDKNIEEKLENTRSGQDFRW